MWRLQVRPGACRAAWRLEAFTRDRSRVLLCSSKAPEFGIQLAIWDFRNHHILEEHNWEGGDWISSMDDYDWREHWVNEADFGPTLAIGPFTFSGDRPPRHYERGQSLIHFGHPPWLKLCWPFQIYEDCLPEWLGGVPFVAAGPSLPSRYVTVSISDLDRPRLPARVSWPIETNRGYWAVAADGSTVVHLDTAERLRVWKLPCARSLELLQMRIIYDIVIWPRTFSGSRSLNIQSELETRRRALGMSRAGLAKSQRRFVADGEPHSCRPRYGS